MWWRNWLHEKIKTGLIKATIGQEVKYSEGNIGRLSAIDRISEFNTVTDKDFIEPDISEYEIEDSDNEISNIIEQESYNKLISIVSTKVRWKSNFFQNYNTNFKFYGIMVS